ADHAELSSTHDTSIYTGHVVLERAGLTLTGNKLVVKRLDDDTYRAELTGDPATLEKTPQSGDEEPINGHSSTMIYTSGNAQLVMRGDAVLKRSGDVIHSKVIRHDL